MSDPLRNMAEEAHDAEIHGSSHVGFLETVGSLVMVLIFLAAVVGIAIAGCRVSDWWRKWTGKQ